MKHIVLALTVVTATLVSSGAAQAGDSFFRLFFTPPRSHTADHAELNHRSYHRGVDHSLAHQLPMTRYQHSSLHGDLDHEAYHDNAAHHSAHVRGAYVPRPSFYYGRGGHHAGFSIQTRRFSFSFGQ
jgi:hypothetical protein